MMATEAAVDKAADAPVTESQPTTTDAHNVDGLDRPAVNGSANNSSSEEIENKHITSVEDQANSADASVSGGSDTEASRADGSKLKDGDKGHGRTGSSVKKPATFKAVSVNKTFLASKATSSSTGRQTPDKPAVGSSTPPTGSATLSASRPRLVAKTGSGTGSSVPRFSSAANGGKPPSAPDPSVVWNKNRPVPPPEPKKFTDEELKKYGIHMASRLNEEDAQGQNKWADIDDDDDDWAPEAITWGDGTKTTLPHPDEPPAPPSESGSVASRGGKSIEKPRSPAPPGATGSPSLKSSGLASGKGLVLKSGGSQEKPTLVAKPAVPAAVKSPWATLPPIDKASPADSTLHRGSSLLKTMTPPPPKEIAADDFSRSTWREGGSHGNRELYNSHSGRYEPVADRRGSFRQEQHPRHPALLQRPPGGQDYPAEPSTAFQTTRSPHDVPFGRRRGSSNVSGGSGSFYQRVGKGFDGHMPPPDHLGVRRPSHAGSIEGPVSPVNLPVHPQGPPRQGSAWVPRASPRAAFATPHQGAAPLEGVAGPPPPPPQPAMDEIEYQKKLMHERTELARKRRQEEEAREEAERKARIQKKLEAMGPPPERKSDKKDTPPKEEAPQPTHIQQRETSQGASQAQPEAQNSSASKPEVAEADAKLSPPAGPPSKTVGSRRVSQSQEQKPTELWSAASTSRPDRFASWTASAQAPSRNVWGSPNNDRGLGNGTFNPDLGRIAGGNAPGTQGSAKGPSPIGPPGASQAPPLGRPQPPAPIGSRTSRYGASSSDIASKWVAAVHENDQKLVSERLVERTERTRQLAERGIAVEDAQPIIKETWRPVHLPGDGTRQAAGRPETQAHQHGPWRASGDDISKITPPPEDLAPSATASGNNSILPQTGKGTSQGRSSRFFPSRDVRLENTPPDDHARSKSPTPPPPTMEGHPAYEGDMTHPHVSLPKPQPVVKLPPAMAAAQGQQSRSSYARAPPISYKDAVRAPAYPPSHHSSLKPAEQSQGDWQVKINNLLNGSRSPPHRSIGVEPSSKSALDHASQHDAATVSLPGVTTIRPIVHPARTYISKPMAEECFEEQEMGSLPQIRLPHRAPEAAWQPAPSPKHLPKKLMVEPTIKTPFYFAAEVIGGGNAMRIQFPGMTEPKIVTVPFSATRGGRSSHGRSGPRPRGSGNERRGGRRDTSSTHGDQSSTTSGRSGRGGYRSRGSSSWHRQSGTPPSLPA